MMQHERRSLIVNADDFGLSAGINRGIIMAHERGIVTSASLMVRWPAAAEAAAYARARPSLGLGLHVDLCEWAYCDEEWRALYTVVPLDDPAAVADEIARQLDAFRHLVGSDPTHLDSHQHMHRDEPARSVMTRLARALGVPLRHVDSRVRYVGDFYGQDDTGTAYPAGIGVDALVHLLATLPLGMTELGCHPGFAEETLATMYKDERRIEVRTLCDAAIRAAISMMHIELRSFHDLATRLAHS